MGKIKPLKLYRAERRVLDAAGYDHVKSFEGPHSCRVGYLRFVSKSNSRLRNSGDRICCFADEDGKRQFGSITKLVLIDERLYAIIRACPQVGNLREHLTLDSCPLPLQPSFASGLYAKEYIRVNVDEAQLTFVSASSILSLCMFVEGPGPETYAIPLVRHYAHD